MSQPTDADSKQFRDMTPEEFKKALLGIIHSSQTVQEVHRRAHDELNYPYAMAVRVEEAREYPPVDTPRTGLIAPILMSGHRLWVMAHTEEGIVSL